MTVFIVDRFESIANERPGLFSMIMIMVLYVTKDNVTLKSDFKICLLHFSFVSGHTSSTRGRTTRNACRTVQ